MNVEALAIVEQLRARIAELEAALQKIAAPTYGTELWETDEERYRTIWGHLSQFQRIAREALQKK